VGDQEAALVAGAEVAVQDAYLRAWRALSSFRAESKLSTWPVRIVTNGALGRLRRAKLRTIPLEDAMTSPDPKMQAALADAHGNGPEQSALRAQVRGLIEERIAQLPDAYRTVFMLRAVEEMSATDVAAALDISGVTVRTRFFRARGVWRGSTDRAEWALASRPRWVDRPGWPSPGSCAWPPRTRRW